MKLKITDDEALQRILPATLHAYAESHGWQPGKIYRGVARIWSCPVGKDDLIDEKPDLTIPICHDIADYATCVSMLIGTWALFSTKEKDAGDELVVYNELLQLQRST